MGKPLTADQIAADFGVKTAIARLAVRTLYEVVDTPGSAAVCGRVESLGNTTSRNPRRPLPAVAKLADRCGIPTDRLRPDAFLFALQTYYAVVIRLLVSRFPEFQEAAPVGENPFDWPMTARSEPIEQLVDRQRSTVMWSTRRSIPVLCFSRAR